MNEPEAVLTGRAGEAWASVNATYVTYTRCGKAITALARPIAGGDAVQLNAPGTEGLSGGIDPGTDRVIYEQWTSRRSGNLFFFDLDSAGRTKVPEVNTRDWEWFPRISSSFIAFQRSSVRNGEGYIDLLVYDRTTGDTRLPTPAHRPVLEYYD